MARKPHPMEIPAPEIDGPGDGILSEIPLLPATDRHLIGGVTYEVDNCFDGNSSVAFDLESCFELAEELYPEEGFDWARSFGFDAYVGVQCKIGPLGGGTEADYIERAKRKFLAGESRYIEQRLINAFENGIPDPDEEGSFILYPASNIKGQNDAAEYTPKQGVAALFDRLGNTKSPTIFASRGTGVLLREDELFDKVDGTLVTGSGLFNPVEGQLGMMWMYGTDAIHIWAGDIQTGVATDHQRNTTVAFAMRQYVVTLDCGVLKVPVRVLPSLPME